MSSPPDAKFKVILLGDMGVGKTSLFFRVKDDEFSHLRNLTLGLDMCVTRVAVGDAVVEISLCDTAGSERYRTLTRNFYRNAQAVLFVFSLDNPGSLYGLGRWEQDARMYAPTALRFLIGNKSDLPCSVAEDTVNTFASSHDCEEAFVVSARTGEGVANILPHVSERLLWRYNQLQKDLETSWLDDKVNVYKGEDIPGHHTHGKQACC
ncbi:ras-related protein rab [Plakobranchus ocellatus]|uniref:Ras-related protein rab n=1 Tax=Plakobranchus ocellatus TaxID=259542 RepID=A0AAV4C2U7_9GAST|nr:ras-related protein rab [Plakobranchus ocellatus]